MAARNRLLQMSYRKEDATERVPPRLELGTSSKTRFSWAPAFLINPEKRLQSSRMVRGRYKKQDATERVPPRLRRRATQGARERRSDVGGDYYLLGRFLRFHLFASARTDPGRRVEHPTMLDNVFDLG